MLIKWKFDGTVKRDIIIDSVFMNEKKNDSCVRKEKFSKEKGAKK